MPSFNKDVSGLRFTLNIKALPSDLFVVAHFTLNESLSAPFSLELEIASASPSIEFGSVLDNIATLTIWRDSEVQRVVNGIVISFEQGDTGLHQTRYRLSVRPMLWRAGLRQHSRIFQQHTIQAILASVLKRNKINHYAFAFRHPHPEREFCIQYQEKDLDFINRMAAEEGIFYFFEHEDGKHTLVFADDCAALNDGPTLPYHPHTTTSFDQPCVTSFKRRESLRPSDVLLKDYTFANPFWEAESRDHARDMEHQTNTYYHYDYPGRYKTTKAGEDFARWRIQALRNDAHQGEGASDCPALQPGVRFTLENHPLDSLNTRWQITHASHSGQQPQALLDANGGQGTTLMSQFAFIPKNQTWRPLSLPKPRIDGAQIAIVTGPEGEEIFCDSHGRVKVHFLWDLSGKRDDTSSCWVRVSHPWAGAGWGMSAIPRIGHEVIVEFLNGDPDQPVIIGRTYHANNRSPGKLPGTKTQMSLRSKTHKGQGFNELRFEDEKDKQEVYIHAQKDMNIEVQHQHSTVVGQNRRNHVKQHDDLRVDGEKRDEILGDYSLTLNKDHHVKIAGKSLLRAEQEVHINSGQTLILDAGKEIVLKVGNSHIRITESGVHIGPRLEVSAGSPSLGTPAAPLLPEQRELTTTEPGFTWLDFSD